VRGHQLAADRESQHDLEDRLTRQTEGLEVRKNVKKTATFTRSRNNERQAHYQRRCATDHEVPLEHQDRCASWNSTAPLYAYSGEQKRSASNIRYYVRSDTSIMTVSPKQKLKTIE
jgi:hypothetical protein